MNISEFDYILPENLIAQMPADKRDNSKMLVLNRQDKTIEDMHFYDITDYIDKLSNPQLKGMLVRNWLNIIGWVLKLKYFY